MDECQLGGAQAGITPRALVKGIWWRYSQSYDQSNCKT